jgi:hypothetical protein
MELESSLLEAMLLQMRSSASDIQRESYGELREFYLSSNQRMQVVRWICEVLLFLSQPAIHP